MAEALNELYSRIISDKAKLAEFKALKTDDELVAFAASYGVKATAEEIRAFIDGKKNAELSEDELDQVAGGKDDGGSSSFTCPSCGSSDVKIQEIVITPGSFDCYCRKCGHQWHV